MLVVSGQRGLFVLLNHHSARFIIIHTFAQALGYYVYETRRAVDDNSSSSWYVLEKCSHLGSHWGSL